jgi:hypothetical protein
MEVIIKTEKRVDELGEVFTPAEVVNDILDEYEDALWSDPTQVWLEPSCGEGNFLVVLLERLMLGLKEWELDDAARHKYIIENMLYGVDIMADNVDICIDRLNARNLNHHIVCADALTYDFSFGKSDPNAVFEIDTTKPAAQISTKIKKETKKVDLENNNLFG